MWSQDRWSLTGSVITILKYKILVLEMCGLSRQVVTHGNSLSRPAGASFSKKLKSCRDLNHGKDNGLYQVISEFKSISRLKIIPEIGPGFPDYVVILRPCNKSYRVCFEQIWIQEKM